MLDWLRLWPALVALNFKKAIHAGGLRKNNRGAGTPPPAFCQSASDSGLPGETRCEACLNFDRAERYRFVCRALLPQTTGTPLCGLRAADIRPEWRRVALWSGALFLSLVVVLTSSAWLTLRYAAGLRTLEYADLAWPGRWNRITEARRQHFQEQAMLAIRQGNIRAAGVALFSAAQTGKGTPEQNHALARLATLGAYYSLADDLHAADLAAHPEQAAELSLYWHDDLLIANRPGQLAKLALDRLASANSPREFWLGAFLDAIRQPRVAAQILASRPERSLPHPSLRHALEARAALDAHDIPKAADRLLAFAGMPPGQAARRFLALSWMDAGEREQPRFPPHTRPSRASWHAWLTRSSTARAAPRMRARFCVRCSPIQRSEPMR